MCAIYGFLNYGKLINHRLLTKILKELSIAAEVRGTDATGISYVRNGKIVTFKKPKPAHKVKLYFPKDTTAVIGHTRFATQGDEKLNYNNHPFDSPMGFALAHNGVLYNDKRLRTAENLPYTQIETDSYVAVQLIEKTGIVDMESIKDMTEKVEGSFVFTILKNDNTLYLVKGSNPITIYHYIDLGLYIYLKQITVTFETITFEVYTDTDHTDIISRTFKRTEFECDIKHRNRRKQADR